MLQKINSYLFIAIVLSLTACKKDKLDVDISNIKTDIEIVRFDKILFNQEVSEAMQQIELFTGTDAYFVTLFSNNIIRIGLPEHPEYKNYLQQFLNDSINNDVADTVFNRFDELDALEKELENAFAHYQYYYPNQQTPNVYTFVSRFNQPIIITDGILGIGLDQYLGSNCKFYEYLGIPAYKRKNMFDKKIVPDVMMAIAMNNFPEPFNNNLLDQMIYHGKLLYFTEAMCRNSAETTIIGFTNSQLEWCKTNEQPIWSYLIENKSLYSRERMVIQRFIGPAPYTNVFGQDSPGRAATWIGWQIVRSYMNENPSITLQQLMKEDNFQKILNFSGYHPN